MTAREYDFFCKLQPTSDDFYSYNLRMQAIMRCMWYSISSDERECPPSCGKSKRTTTCRMTNDNDFYSLR
jgi:hypothetical protein